MKVTLAPGATNTKASPAVLDGPNAYIQAHKEVPGMVSPVWGCLI